MTRYLIFAGERYNSAGGAGDLLMDADDYQADFIDCLTEDEAHFYLDKAVSISWLDRYTKYDLDVPQPNKFDWYQVYDLLEKRIIIERKKT
ncbi:MAG: hypothetical protein WBB28_09510 [Crinalium sp.]